MTTAMTGTRTERQRRGDRGEALARAHLERAGLRTRARNWRCRHGEIDLVMTEGSAVVFVEVRMRSSDGFGGALASIDAGKRRRLVRAAAAWLQRHRLGDRPARFDVVGVGADGTIEWHRAAFEAG